MRFSKFRAPALTALMLVLAAITSAAPADAPAAPPGPGPAWDALKSLQGEWEGLYNGTMKTRITYRLVSNGTALMETSVSPESGDMVTMYHPDGKRLFLTHYCSMNAQSRMQAAAGDAKRIVFSFVDVTNLASPDAMRMTGLVFTLKDPDHFTQEWTATAGGKSDTGRFEFTRKK